MRFYAVLFLSLCLCGIVVYALPQGEATAQTTHGMMIDAGSSGSRMHVFSWTKRVFKHFPVPLSIPENDMMYTTRIQPGIHTFLGGLKSKKKLSKQTHQSIDGTKDALDVESLRDHISFLISYAKRQLMPYEEHWSTFPLYLRATGGVRSLSAFNRSLLLDSIRAMLENKSYCPFYVQYDSVRVLGGEEEAAFSWTAANYLHNRLLPDMKDLEDGLRYESSHGAVVSVVKDTYGTVDLGASSSQISFFVPSQDISEGIYKLQLGIYEHWNLYTKSFLQYGYDTARIRHLRELAHETVVMMDDQSKAVVPRALDYCFFAGYSEAVDVDIIDSSGKHSVEGTISVEVHGPAVPAGDQMQRCMQSLRGLLRTEENAFCNIVNNGACSMNGAYQPPLPQQKASHFVGTSTYQYPWQFLQMPSIGTVSQFKDAASGICSKSFNDIVLYDATLTYIKTPKHSSLLPYYCFLSSYVVVLLEDGYGFTENNTISTQGEVKGNKVNWAYGAMLYEVNSLPFEMVEPDEIRLMGRLLLAWVCGLVAGIIIVGGILSQFLYKPNQQPSQEIGEQSTDDTKAPAASSFYHDLAKIYHGGGNSSGESSRTDFKSGDISQYSPFANQTGNMESSNLLVHKHRGGGTRSVDSNSSTDTIRVLKQESSKNKNYQSI